MAEAVTLNGSTDAAALIDDAAWGAAREYAAAPHTAVEGTARLRWLITGAPYEELNGIYWADSGIDLSRALEPFRQAEVPMLWHVGPTSPPALGERLRGRLRHYGDEPGMLLALDDTPPDSDDSYPWGLEIARVGTTSQLRAWVRLWAGPASDLVVDRLVALRAPSAFGVGARTPHLLGLLDGEPVACAAVWVGRPPVRSGGANDRSRPASRRPVAWLEHVATRLAVRGRGIGTALTRACLDIARRRAASHAALTASSAAVRLYQRLGFRQICTVTRYIWTPSAGTTR